MVFARLDGADADEIWPLVGVCRRSRRRLTRAKRRDEDWRRSPDPLEIGLKGFADVGGADNNRIPKLRCRFDPLPVARVLPRLGIFGKLDRDQIVDQADETRSRAAFEALDCATCLETIVRDQEIDGFPVTSRWRCRQRPFVAENGPDPQLQSQLLDPPEMRTR